MKIKSRYVSKFFSLLKDEFITNKTNKHVVTNIYVSYLSSKIAFNSNATYKYIIKFTNNNFYKSYISNLLVKNNIEINSSWLNFFIFQFKRYHRLNWMDNWELTKSIKEIDFTNYQLFDNEEFYIKKYIKNEK